MGNRNNNPAHSIGAQHQTALTDSDGSVDGGQTLHHVGLDVSESGGCGRRGDRIVLDLRWSDVEAHLGRRKSIVCH